ncbi:hypothetical protein LY78DRAFT_658755 [Colletotrichum sublineola]|uniref:Uncharacterized protein n=1 Tax=Colletotrichum sublineola TaxID=1173701 RepID=A0A066XBQ0_COLSU|nr:hypothetical protein LY78DRAFT_658755 [Colletotrichum sublineola]KDN66367.1 hypothetical protein CSUB01_07462 [Colletotrichum sublineola]
MFNHIMKYMAPLPRPVPIVCYPSGCYVGLDAIERRGRGNSDPASRFGFARSIAIRQQDRLHADRLRLLEAQVEDNMALEAEHDTRVKEVLNEYYSDLQSLRTDPRSNGNILKAKKFTKKLQRRVKDLRDKRFRNQTWLNLWYENRANQYMDFLRVEWMVSDYCCDYPFWGDEMAPNVKL